jgi:dephospho-CoA kinase
MLVIGLTGGIGSGKTTVAKLFANRGITIIDTDQLARDVTDFGQAALAKIAEKFGPEILFANGTLNRVALRKIVFADEAKRRWLEELLHPLIRTEIKKQVNQAQSPYCIVVIPLLFETEPNPLIQRILVVDTPEKNQIERTQNRDGMPLEEIEAILLTQVNRAHRLKKAHDIIENHGSIADLERQVNRLDELYRHMNHPEVPATKN